MIKVLMISRATLFSSPGGDTIQLEETANHLRRLDVLVDIKLTDEKIDYDQYDLIHFFNIIRPNDILRHLSETDLPYVLSTIFVDYTEYEKKTRRGVLGCLGRFMSSDFIEYLKVIARTCKNGEKIGHYSYILNGHKSSIKKIIRKASCLLPNSSSEYKRLVKSYGIENRYEVIPNSINTDKFYNSNFGQKERKTVICVARVEGRKNQLNLIKALANENYNLLIIGNPSPNNLNYYRLCKNTAGENVQFISHITQKELNSFYNEAKVHVLPSWFETTGLASLEAGYLGCNLVVTDKGDVKEYFKDYAAYCNPEDTNSIKLAVIEAYNKVNDYELKRHIEENFTWSITAEKTKEAYLNVLNNRHDD
jgi:glycosyltransferase involved in cell wall biosynthesis